jgi:hypothetical protein
MLRKLVANFLILAMHYGILNAYLQTITANFVHYFTSKFADYYLLKDRKVDSYLGRKLISYSSKY